MNTRFVLAALVVAMLSACTSSFWYTQIQGAQYDKCDKLAAAEDRRRCRAETQPDKDKYDKDREATRGASK
ncbi:MAG TPA: hypothetical protein VFU71_14475 [Burkholderiaceae bacterium]|nr:hypothetical protein [Burkholderiaceae bacterium]